MNVSTTKERKRVPVFIPKARTRSRNVSGSPARSASAVCGSRSDIRYNYYWHDLIAIAMISFLLCRRQSSRSVENVSIVGGRGMPPPDILAHIQTKQEARHSTKQHSGKEDRMGDVLAQLSTVLGQRNTVEMVKRPDTRDAEADEEEAEAGVMTDVQSCLDYIDGLLATPSMIDIPRTEVSH